MQRLETIKPNRASRKSVRNDRGAALTIMLFLSALTVSLLSAIITVDMAHQNSVRAELHAACDAGAMAGEDVMLSTNSSAQAIAAATSLVNANLADGKTIGSMSGASVQVSIGNSGSLPTTTVTVSAPVRNIFATLINHNTDTLSARSVAGPGQTKQASSPFPLTVINRDYRPGQTYTWYISDAPGLAPNLVTALSSILTTPSVGSSSAPYPGTMLGNNTARFLTTFNTYNSSFTGNILNSTGSALGLGQVGTVLGGAVTPATGSGGSVTTLLTSLLFGSSSSAVDTSALSMLTYWSLHNAPVTGRGAFELATSTQPSANLGSFPTVPTNPIAAPALMVGQQVFVTTGANSNNNNNLNTTAQFLQGSTGNRASGTLWDTYNSSYSVTGAGLPSTPSLELAGSLASWLNGATVVLPVTTPIPTSTKLTLPIVNINLLGTSDSTSSTYSTTTNGLLGSVTGPLTAVGTASPTAAVVNKFIAVKMKSVTVEYRGARGLNLLGLGLLNDPWAQQVIRITGEVQSTAGGGGYGGASYGNGSAGAYAAMLIE